MSAAIKGFAIGIAAGLAFGTLLGAVAMFELLMEGDAHDRD